MSPLRPPRSALLLVGSALAILIFVISTQHRWRHTIAPAPPAYGSPEDEIRTAALEAIVRASPAASKEQVRFIGFWGTNRTVPDDPSPAFLARLEQRIGPVRPASRGEVLNRGVVDQRTGEIGCLYTVDRIRWIDGATVVVETQQIRATLGGFVIRCTLLRRPEGWVVTREDPKALT